MSEREKRLLIVTTHFPPEGRAGTLRVLKLIKYLTRLDWEISVLTVKPELSYHKTRQDRSLIDRVPDGITVYRTAALRPRWPLSGLNSYLVPDREAGWVPFGAVVGLKALRRHRIGWIFSTAPPWSTHLVGLWMKRRTGARWVADVRDPWTRRPWMRPEAQRGLRYRLLQTIERAVVRAADRVVLNTDELCRDFRAHYADVASDRFLTITNGFDPEDYGQLTASRESPPECFVIVHGGSLYRKRDPRLFLKPIRSLMDHGVVTEDKLRIEFVGGVEPEFDLLARVRDLGLERVVRVRATLPHREYLGLIAGADLALLIQPDTDLQVPSKLFEYMALGKGVLALAHEGATKELVSRYPRGVVVDPRDEGAIREALARLIKDRADSAPPGGVPPEVAVFSAETLARMLDAALLECAS